jgi:hypothetical protein
MERVATAETAAMAVTAAMAELVVPAAPVEPVEPVEPAERVVPEGKADRAVRVALRGKAALLVPTVPPALRERRALQGPRALREHPGPPARPTLRAEPFKRI